MFAPASYLAFNRDADYFWAPLTGLHLGCRLGEIVTLRLDTIFQDPDSKLWCIRIDDEVAKNENSVRRLPVPTRLIKLGFLRYVRHVAGRGATHLFPHRDLTTPTALRDPSKRCSKQFGDYLTELGIIDPSLVFHGFRHTVVTALQDGGTPISDSMQIVGHSAQEFALTSGRVTAKQATGVHTGVYSHADAARMNVAHPLLRLKAHLDRCVTPPLAYRRLRMAAEIVRRHTVPHASGVGFDSGWSKLRVKHTEAMVKSLTYR